MSNNSTSFKYIDTYAIAEYPADIGNVLDDTVVIPFIEARTKDLSLITLSQ